MKGIISIIILLLAILQAVNGQTLAEGYVFVDTNDNSLFDIGEPTLSDVPVSNGSDIVLTDSNGKYTIEVDNETILFVIKPSGYKYILDQFNKPLFYYIHKPNGSPKLFYPGTSPTGPLPEYVNFGLKVDDDQSKYDVLLFGDPQPYTLSEVNYFDKDIVNELSETSKYEFGFTVGDIVGDDLSLFSPYLESISRIGIPWYHVYGNHDMNFDAESDDYADETYEEYFGPTTYSFNHGKVHFIVADNVIYPLPSGQSGYTGGFTTQKLEFIKKSLELVPRDYLVIFLAHIPLFVPEWREYDEYFRSSDRRNLFKILSTHPNVISISAHTHVQRLEYIDALFGWDKPIPHLHYNVGTTSGDWWSGELDDRGIPSSLMRDGTPNGYGILRIDNNNFEIDYKVANENESKKMSVWGPKIVPSKERFKADFYVNYFLGTDSTIVEYQIPGTDKWFPMVKDEVTDPYVNQLYIKWDTNEQVLNGKRPSNPVRTTHLWKARVPRNLPNGVHTLEIRVTDEFGRTFFDEYTYTVTSR